jgi:hypothetical protein
MEVNENNSENNSSDDEFISEELFNKLKIKCNQDIYGKKEINYLAQKEIIDNKKNKNNIYVSKKRKRHNISVTSANPANVAAKSKDIIKRQFNPKLPIPYLF